MSIPFQATVVIVCAGEVELQGDHITVIIRGKPQVLFPIMTVNRPEDLPDDEAARELVFKVIAHNVVGAARKILEVPGITTGVPMPVTDVPPEGRS